MQDLPRPDQRRALARLITQSLELADTLGENFGEHEGYHTVAGLILHQISRVPDEGEVVQVGRFEVEVVDMDDRRIDKLIFKELIQAQEERAAIAAHLED
jgi:putative hemolysin